MAKILVIDDQEDIREVLCCILEEAGHVVRQAADGKAGLQICMHSPIEIVITDLHMPGMNGFETVCALREHLPQIRIVAMSGADTDSVETNLESSLIDGADWTLLKPFRMDEVLKAVRALES